MRALNMEFAAFLHSLVFVVYLQAFLIKSFQLIVTFFSLRILSHYFLNFRGRKLTKSAVYSQLFCLTERSIVNKKF